MANENIGFKVVSPQKDIALAAIRAIVHIVDSKNVTDAARIAALESIRMVGSPGPTNISGCSVTIGPKSK